MSTYVTAQVFAKNTIDLSPCLPVESLNCDNIRIGSMYWGVPQIIHGQFAGYKRLMSNTKPTPDSVRLIGLYDFRAFINYYLPVVDDATPTTWSDLCNGCCGTNPALANYVVPVPIVEDSPCPDVPGGTPTYTYEFLLPANPNSLNIALAGSFNGSYGTPTPTVGGYANYAAIQTWLAANWSAYGTWTQHTVGSNTFQKLVSTTSISAGVQFGLVPKNYCLAIPAGTNNINTLTADGVDIPLGFTLAMNPSNPQALFNALAPYLNQDNGLSFRTAGTPATSKIGYNGTLVPQSVKLDASVIASFTSGVCPFTFLFTIPAFVGGQHYHVTQASFDGTPATADITGQAFASIAAMLTWLNVAAPTGWGSYGTWTSPDGTHIQLSSTTVTTVTNLTVTES